MVQFQRRVKHRQRKWYHSKKGLKIINENGTILVRKGSKFLNKNDTISEKGQKSSTKMVPFQKRVKYPQQKWYHFSQKNDQNSSTKKGTISEKGQKFSTKMVPFQKKVKNPR